MLIKGQVCKNNLRGVSPLNSKSVGNVAPHHVRLGGEQRRKRWQDLTGSVKVSRYIDAQNAFKTPIMFHAHLLHTMTSLFFPIKISAGWGTFTVLSPLWADQWTSRPQSHQRYRSVVFFSLFFYFSTKMLIKCEWWSNNAAVSVLGVRSTDSHTCSRFNHEMEPFVYLARLIHCAQDVLHSFITPISIWALVNYSHWPVGLKCNTSSVRGSSSVRSQQRPVLKNAISAVLRGLFLHQPLALYPNKLALFFLLFHSLVLSRLEEKVFKNKYATFCP